MFTGISSFLITSGFFSSATGQHLTPHLFLPETRRYITLIFSTWFLRPLTYIRFLSHLFLNLLASVCLCFSLSSTSVFLFSSSQLILFPQVSNPFIFLILCQDLSLFSSLLIPSPLPLSISILLFFFLGSPLH